MGQLIKACDAYGEHEAILIQTALSNAGIKCILHLNEIPMHPGFTFGCIPWAEVFVLAIDRQPTLDALESIPLRESEAAESLSFWPPNVSLESNHTIAWLFVIAYAQLPTLLNVTTFVIGHELAGHIAFLYLAAPALFALCILAKNWHMLSRAIQQAFIGLAALLPGAIILLVGLAILLFNAAKALWRVFTYLMSNRP